MIAKIPSHFRIHSNVPKSVLTTGSLAISSTCLKKGHAVDKFVMFNLVSLTVLFFIRGLATLIGFVHPVVSL